jgi:hypothetical protein
MIFVLKSIELPRKNGVERKNNLEKNLGTKIPKKSTFFSKNLKIQKFEKSELYKRQNWTMVPLCLKNN